MNRNWRTFSVKVRRRETPFYDRLYRFGKWVRGLSVPCVGPLHSLMYNEWVLRTSLWHNFWRVVYYEPMFKSQCKSVGPGFRMEYAGNGSAHILGDLQVYLGSNVTIFDNTYFLGLKVLDKPTLYVGDNSFIGGLLRFIVAKEIRIGRNCLIASRLITDNVGHSPKNILSRMQGGGGSPGLDEIKPVHIGDFVMLPMGSYVYPGVTIGDGVAARAGTHIDHDVPPFCIVGGNPGRIIRKIPIPRELINIVGQERYESYLKAHEELKL